MTCRVSRFSKILPSGLQRSLPCALASAFLASLVTQAAWAAPESVVSASSCALPVEAWHAEAGLPRTAAAVAAGKPLKIVAIGSSSTEGTGATEGNPNYPTWVQRLLRTAFPKQNAVVVNRGIGGELAQDMTARFERDVLAEKPDLVLWQTGTNEALRRTAIPAMLGILKDGVARLRAAGIDVMLIGPQRSAKLEQRIADYGDYVRAMTAFARSAQVAYFDRYAAMRHWEERPERRPVFLSADALHLNNEGYRCFGTAVFEAIRCAAGGACPRPADLPVIQVRRE